MLPIALISMPFGALHTPSLGLTQIRALLDRDFAGRTAAKLFYLNHDFAQFFGLELYRYLSDDSRTTVTGLTDWLLRDIAFPEANDTSDQYIARYMPALGCRCEDGKRRELDGCASSPNCCSIEPNTVPCCLEPGILGQLLERRARLPDFLDELIDRHDLLSYPLIGFTAMFDQTVPSLAMARRLKERNPKAITLFGGASCEPGVAQVIARRFPAIDYAFAGPALRSFPDFLTHFLSGEHERCRDIPGVYGRDPAGHCVSPPGVIGEQADIDDLLRLDYDEFFALAHKTCPEIEPELFFETSRGCWWGERSHCTFCGINGLTMKYRSMAPATAIEQFEDLFSRYPQVKRFVAIDNILDEDYYDQVLPFVRAPAGASIFYELKVVNDEARIAALAKAGVTHVQPGIEALSTAMLKLMGKGTTASKNIDFLKRAMRHGIELDWNLLTGFPNEDGAVYKQYLAAIPLLVHLPAPVATFPVRFDRHSPYFKNPAIHGIELKPLDFYYLIYPFPDEDIRQFAYFWADQSFRNSYLFNIARFQRRIEGAIDYWRKRWYRRDGLVAPELRFEDGGRAIHDSRAGTAIKLQLSEMGAELLALLRKPMRAETLAVVTGCSLAEVDTELSVLDEHKLLFHDRERMLSLVCDGVIGESANRVDQFEASDIWAFTGDATVASSYPIVAANPPQRVAR